MPYIEPLFRDDYDELIRRLVFSVNYYKEQYRAGHLNYIITTLLKRIYDDASYSNYNAAIGVLECVKQEFYRTAVAPYEDIKRKENGDVE